ncbi:MAG TPA: DUF1571 domain-containing protein [Pirellulales bacterium]|nr:DUF1571 domain-containing protein [Pirellulales bacterium]
MSLFVRIVRRLSFACLAAVMGCGGPPPGPQPSGPTTSAHGSPQASDNQAGLPEKKSAVKSAAADKVKKRGTNKSPPADTLDAALALAKHSLATLESVKDYTGEFTKRERVGDDLLSQERNVIKLRHKPFSVYLRVVEPASSAGQEVIYVEGRNNGNLIAHTTGFGSNVIGRLSLDPHGFIATRGNRYTIKDVGLKNLVLKLLELGRRKELFRESTVKIEKIKFDERPCTQVEISSPHSIGDFRLAIARIVLDDKWDVPVHFESHEWPAEGGEKSVLSETYSYYNLEFDVGLTDRDFDPDNPEYAFP